MFERLAIDVLSACDLNAAAGRGQDYITIVSDLDAGTVEFIAYESMAASKDLRLYSFENLPPSTPTGSPSCAPLI